MAPAAVEKAHDVGPSSSDIQVADSYIFEQAIQLQLVSTGSSIQRDTDYRLSGVQIIHDVRNYMNLPAQTYTCACLFFHKFRLKPRDLTYQCEDAAIAALFAACKIQDTLKKSKDILCAAHNMKVSPSDAKSPDDNIFEQPSKTVIGIERLMLESSKFDFRSRFPHKHILKLAKFMTIPRQVAKVALDICNDMYKTFAPLKQTTYTMATAVLELAARITGTEFVEAKWKDLDTIQPFRAAVMETMLDLVDLYTHHTRFTIVGPKYDVNIFIKLRITLNTESQERGFHRCTHWIDKTNGVKHKGTPKTPITPASPTPPVNGVSPATLSPRSAAAAKGNLNPGTHGPIGTVRFMLDAEKAKQEKVTVDKYYKVEMEEYEEEEEEPVAPRTERVDNGSHRGRDERYHGGGYRGGRRGRR